MFVRIIEFIVYFYKPVEPVVHQQDCGKEESVSSHYPVNHLADGSSPTLSVFILIKHFLLLWCKGECQISMVLGGIDICSDGFCLKFNMVITVLYINYSRYARYNICMIKSKIMICILCV